ncbi:integrase core domain-containing protein [Paucibacter sp. B51]|uniref:integrase core domain-containing protein n=1 Tax=Paucibacter sp. B51 TaxID=2993315 RepID=UPI0022EBBA11|nr:integrase core domain-containing protein [Paucibacter sp. B51]
MDAPLDACIITASSPCNTRRLIGDWSHCYNHRRPHQALNMKTPAEAFALAA